MAVKGGHISWLRFPLTRRVTPHPLKTKHREQEVARNNGVTLPHLKNDEGLRRSGEGAAELASRTARMKERAKDATERWNKARSMMENTQKELEKQRREVHAMNAKRRLLDTHALRLESAWEQQKEKEESGRVVGTPNDLRQVHTYVLFFVVHAVSPCILYAVGSAACQRGNRPVNSVTPQLETDDGSVSSYLSSTSYCPFAQVSVFACCLLHIDLLNFLLSVWFVVVSAFPSPLLLSDKSGGFRSYRATSEYARRSSPRTR